MASLRYVSKGDQCSGSVQKQREDWVLERLLRLLPGSRPGGGEGDTGSRTADPACQWDGMEGPESEHFSRQNPEELYN